MGKYCKYNPHMDEMWHFVPMPTGDTKPYSPERQALKDQCENWCNEMSHGRWSMGYKKAVFGPGVRLVLSDGGFFFKGPRDAMLFKLTWGGV